MGLAFLTAVQVLPPRQRAMFVLCDVLEWPASDVAKALETSVTAVYSGVRRARAGDPRWSAASIAQLARMAMPPDPRSFDGAEAIIGYFDSIFSLPPEQRIRLAPTSANGLPAFIVLAPDQPTGALRRIGLKVLLVRDGCIAEIRGYMRADLAGRLEAMRDGGLRRTFTRRPGRPGMRVITIATAMPVGRSGRACSGSRWPGSRRCDRPRLQGR